MDIHFKHRWIKFIPLLGVFPCLIDSSWDGDFWELGYRAYHASCLAILILIIT